MNALFYNLCSQAHGDYYSSYILQESKDIMINFECSKLQNTTFIPVSTVYAKALLLFHTEHIARMFNLQQICVLPHFQIP